MNLSLNGGETVFCFEATASCLVLENYLVWFKISNHCVICCKKEVYHKVHKENFTRNTKI